MYNITGQADPLHAIPREADSGGAAATPIVGGQGEIGGRAIGVASMSSPAAQVVIGLGIGGSAGREQAIASAGQAGALEIFEGEHMVACSQLNGAGDLTILV